MLLHFLCRCNSFRHQTVEDIRTCNVVADSLYSKMNSCSRFVDTDCYRLEALLAGLTRSELEQDLHPVILNILAPTTMSKSLRHSMYWVVVLWPVSVSMGSVCVQFACSLCACVGFLTQSKDTYVYTYSKQCEWQCANPWLYLRWGKKSHVNSCLI